LVGRPDLDLRQIAHGDQKGKWEVEVRGFDYYNTRTGTIESGDTSKIAMWLFDTDYDGRSLYPRHKLRQGQTCRVLIRNWHKLDWETDEQIRKKRSVDKRGAKSDEAYVREVLGEMASCAEHHSDQ